MPRLGIKFKTAFGITLAVLASFVAFAAIQSYGLRVNLREQIGAQQLSLMKIIVAEIDKSLASNQNVLVAVAQSVPAGQVEDRDAMHALLTQRPALSALFDNVTVIASNGRVTAGAPNRALVGQDFADRPYVKRTLESARPLISEPFIAKPLNEPVIVMSAPIFDSKRRVVAMLVGTIQLLKPNFLGRLADAPIGKTGRFALIGRDRTIILSRDRNRIMTPGSAPGVSEFIDRAVAGESGWMEATNSQKLRAVYSFAPLSNVPWILVAAIPVEEAFAPLVEARKRTYMMATVLALLMPLFAWFCVSRLLAPLTALRDGVRALRRDPRSSQPLPVARADEIGELALDFNALIAERQATGDALAESEDRLHVITDHMPVLIGYMDCDERYRFVNRTFGQWYGRDQSDYLGRTMAEMVGPEAYEALGPQLRRALAGETVQYAREMRETDLRRNVEGSYIPHIGADGKVCGVFVLVSDVSALKDAERRADEGRDAIRSLIESARDAILSVDEKQRVVRFNHAAEAMFGFTSAEIIGQPLDRLIPAGARAGHARHVQKFGAGGESGRNMSGGDRVVNGLRRDGSEFPVEASISKVERGEGAEYTVIMRDVTERVRAVAQVQATAALLRRTVETLPMGVSVLDADLNMLAFNDRLLDLLGFPREEFTYSDPLEKFFRYNAERGEYGVGDPETQVNDRLALARRGEAHCFERVRADGTVLEVRGTPVPGGGFVTIYTDITARREESRRLVEARENAEATARAKSEFLATMSHEVRTPMNGVLGIAELLLDTPLNPEQRDFAETILRSGHALLEILNDILDLSKIEAGKLELEEVAFDPVLTLRDVVALSMPLAAAKDLTLAIDLADDVPRDVVGDPGRLRQVLSNLVGNALKFTDTGQVSVSLRVVGNEGGDVVLGVSITDTGIGMTPEQQSRLFQPFSQADASTTRRFGGTGLGLAICLKLVDMMGGKFSVASVPGSGSTFSFTLRCRCAAPGSVRIAETRLESRFSGRVLVVEDNVVNRKVARATLAGFGLVVLEAENGALALQTLAREPVGLVLMDMHMPVMDGLEATRRIRAAEAAGELQGRRPIVAMTANVLREAVEACMAAGMDGTLPKPFQRRQMVETLARWLPARINGVAGDADATVAAADTAQPVSLASAQSAIELATFRVLAETMEDELPSLVGEFLSDTGRMMGALKMPCDGGNLAVVEGHAHTLKSSAALVGALGLAALARAAEQQAAGTEMAALEISLAQIEPEFARVRAELEQHLNKEMSHD
jgi:PAS domain S-box-containing protein